MNSVRILIRLILVLLLFICAMPQLSCDKGDDPSRREQPGGGEGDEQDKPGNERPGGNKPDFNLAKELADPTLRYSGPELKLRFDRGGILFRKRSDGSHEIINLDGDGRVEFHAGSMRADSLCPDARLTISGKLVALKSVKIKKQTAEAAWYHITGSDGHDRVMVLP